MTLKNDLFSRDVINEIHKRNLANRKKMWLSFVYDNGNRIGVATIGGPDGVSIKLDDVVAEDGYEKSDIFATVQSIPILPTMTKKVKAVRKHFHGFVLACPFRRAIVKDIVQRHAITYMEGSKTVVKTMVFPGARSLDYMKRSNPEYCDDKEKLIDALLEYRNGRDGGIDWDAYQRVAVDCVIENSLVCTRCGGAGVIETGNNDLPCDCPAGDTALFNTCWHDRPVTKKEMEEFPYGFDKTPEEVEELERKRKKLISEANKD
jgi:hypothetical protein